MLFEFSRKLWTKWFRCMLQNGKLQVTQNGMLQVACFRMACCKQCVPYEMHANLTVSISVSMSISGLMQSLSFASLRNPHESLSMVIAFSHLYGTLEPEIGEKIINQIKPCTMAFMANSNKIQIFQHSGVHKSRAHTLQTILQEIVRWYYVAFFLLGDGFLSDITYLYANDILWCEGLISQIFVLVQVESVSMHLEL